MPVTLLEDLRSGAMNGGGAQSPLCQGCGGGTPGAPLDGSELLMADGALPHTFPE